MRRHLQQVGCELVIGLLLALAGTLVYLVTLEPSTSFWDCGEFIAVAYYLQVGHAPGAPFYQLLAHVFSWFAGGYMMAVARCCNALSAVAGGFTVMFLFWSVLLLFGAPGCATRSQLVGAWVGSLCYLFCDTAWFSAVESEVYSLAMLIASAIVWCMMRWYRAADRVQSQRWLLLVSLLLGLGVCTHLLTLLTAPVLLLLFLFKHAEDRWRHLLRLLPMLLLFFLVGLSPYGIVPIRAAANTPINEGNPSTAAAFKSYVSRDRYEKAPIYPRMWRHHRNEDLYAADWCGGDTTLAGNLRYYGSYQLTYMYLRYLLWNFAGRYNDRQGYGSPQNGQFITGIPPIDRQLVGTGVRPPESLHTRGHNVYYLLPLLLGLLGMVALADDKRMFWLAMILFLMGGVVLNLYLNHPCYEPRERDYAYILSFYAFCLFIAAGAGWLMQQVFAVRRRPLRRGMAVGIALLLTGVPALMACQNWDDHDRSGRFIAHDAGFNILNSCSRDLRGALLFTYGDNDTFPLWYLQTVEEVRPDVQVENIGLIGWHRFSELLDESRQTGRLVYFTHYAYNEYHPLFEGRLQLEGNAYRLADTLCDSVAVAPFFQHLMEQMAWQSVEGVYVDEVGCKFIEQYWRDVVLLCENLNDQGLFKESAAALDKTITELPLETLQDVTLVHRIGECCAAAGNDGAARYVGDYLSTILRDQLRYFHTMPLRRQQAMPYTLGPREELAQTIGCDK